MECVLIIMYTYTYIYMSGARHKHVFIHVQKDVSEMFKSLTCLSIISIDRYVGAFYALPLTLYKIILLLLFFSFNCKQMSIKYVVIYSNFFFGIFLLLMTFHSSKLLLLCTHTIAYKIQKNKMHYSREQKDFYICSL